MTAAKKGLSEGILAKTPLPNGINGENGEVVPTEGGEGEIPLDMELPKRTVYKT